MSSSFGKNVKISVFGESHGPGVGIVVDGLPPGEKIDLDRLSAFLSRRAPGKSEYVTPRGESDVPDILSGLTNGQTNGAPLCAFIANKNTHPGDYESLRDTPRPSHADYPAHVKYGGASDIRGGGHFSGRLTAPLCIAGGVALQILERRGVTVGAHLFSVGKTLDTPFDPVNATREDLLSPSRRDFPTLCEAAGLEMKKVIQKAGESLDSVGGSVEGCAIGVPAGLGEPMFGGLENVLSAALFAVPAVKGVEFGAGCSSSRALGSDMNDAYYFDEEGRVRTKTNRHGGILGGISTGMPILLRAHFKPTPSIGKEQDTVNLATKEAVKLSVKGRHDPCVAVRAVPVVESVMAVVLLDFFR